MTDYTFSIPGLVSARSSGVYEMAEDKGRRRAPRRRKSSEEAILTQRVRDRGTATIYDQLRNDPVVAWAFGKFLDYTTVQYFAAKTDDSQFNDELEEAFGDWCRAKNCDVARRNDFDNMVRIFGGALALDGDAALLKIDGGRLQGIESDRIRESGSIANGQIPPSVNGVRLDPSTGAALGYLLFDRGPNGVGYVYNRELSPDDLIFRGNFIRFDQVRGIPMVAPSVNVFQDVKETDEYQRLKAKNHALLGVAVTSSAGSGLDEFGGAPLSVPQPGVSGGDGESETVKSAYGYYDIEAATKLELDRGDSVSLLESHTPSNEYQSFNDSLIRRGLLIFGLAFSFYDSRSSTYAAMKQDRAEFKFFVQRFMRMNMDLRYEITDWILPQLLRDYGLRWSGAGRIRYEWLPQAEPWLEESSEVTSALNRIAGGLSSVEDEVKRRGGDCFDVARKTARYQEYVRKAKIVYSIGNPGGNLFNSDTLNSSTLTVSGARPEDGETGKDAENETDEK